MIFKPIRRVITVEHKNYGQPSDCPHLQDSDREIQFMAFQSTPAQGGGIWVRKLHAADRKRCRDSDHKVFDLRMLVPMNICTDSVVNALAYHQCGRDSIPSVGT